MQAHTIEDAIAASRQPVGVHELFRFGPLPEPVPALPPAYDPKTHQTFVCYQASDHDIYLQRIQWRMMQRALIVGALSALAGAFFGWVMAR